jgi:hypothetical protein
VYFSDFKKKLPWSFHRRCWGGGEARGGRGDAVDNSMINYRRKVIGDLLQLVRKRCKMLEIRIFAYRVVPWIPYWNVKIAEPLERRL